MEVQRFNQSFEELVAILHGEDCCVAAYAVQALGELGNEQAIGPLLEMLTPAKVGRTHVSDLTNALAILGDESIIEPLWNIVLNPTFSEITRRLFTVPLVKLGLRGQTLLFAGLQHADAGVRRAVMCGLSHLGNVAAMEALATVVQLETDAAVRTAAIRDLGYSGNPQALEPLLKVVENNVDPQRPEAISTLGYTNNPAAIPVLANILLTDKNRRVRSLAAEALSYLKFETATQPLLKGLLEDSYSIVRYTCVCALWSHAGEPIARELFFALHDPVASVRAEVAGLLGAANDPQAIRPLLEVVLNEAEKLNVRESAILALGKLKATATKDSLLSLLSHKKSNLRAAAAEALGNLGELDVFEALVKALTDRFPVVREKAISGLAALKHPDSASALLARLEFERESYFCDDLVDTLGKLGDKRALEPLLKELSLNTVSQSYVLSALGDLGDSRASDAVAKFIQAADADMRQVAVCALAKLGDARGIDALVYQLRDYNYDTRYWAINVLTELGEKALPALPTLDWLSQHDRNERLFGKAELTIRQAAANAMEKILAAL